MVTIAETGTRAQDTEADDYERRRLEKLRSYEILDTAPDVRFDRLARLAADVLDMPIALVTFMDDQRGWGKASYGIDFSEVPRDVSFCTYTIGGNEILEVADAREHVLFKDNHFVTGEPYVRYYAGAPLMTNDGYRIGTLCVVDLKPRELNDTERRILTNLAAMVIDELELKKVAHTAISDAETVKASERQTREVLDAVPALVWVTDENRSAVFFNQAWLGFTGRSMDQELGERWTECIHPDDQERCKDVHKRTVAMREAYTLEYRLRRFDGQYRWMIEHGRPRFDDRGQFIGMIGGCSDIADLKMTELKLEERTRELDTASRRAESEAAKAKAGEHWVRKMLDETPALLWVTEPGKGSTFFNKRWLEFTGIPIEEQLGEGWRKLMHPDDAEQCHNLFEDCLAKRAVFAAEYRLRRGDGEYCWLLSAGNPRYDAEGRFIGYLGNCVDITALKVAEADLEQRTGELESSNNALEQFAAAAAHDLKAPLRHISQYARLLTTDFGDGLSPEAEDCVTQISKSASAMQTMVTSLLQLAQLQIGGSHWRFERFNLGSVVDDARTQLGHGDLEVEHGELPDVTGAPVLLVQLFQNLLDNAYKYRNGAAVKVTIDAESEIDFVKVSVTDNGMGIDTQYADIIFSAFKRVAPASENEGVGMGLTLCRRIIELHGGRIWFDTDHAPGSRFHFTLRSRPLDVKDERTAGDQAII